jgi:hypothetical protein
LTEIPVARGERIPWAAAPPRIHEAVAEFLGGPVVAATTQPHGFSPAVAARVVTAQGRRAFVKAVPPDVNPNTPTIYRREIEAASALPDGIPAPRLLWSLDEGADGWVVLLFEDVDGRPPRLPWTAPDLGAAIEAVDVLAEKLTPSPLAAGQQGERMAADWARWGELAAAPPPDLEPWFSSHVGDLVDIESQLAELTRGETLVHSDVRSDNLIIAADRCWVVDWAWPLNGAPWMDVVVFALFVEGEGGPAADEVLAMSRTGRSAPAAGVLSLLCTVAGGLTWQANRPAMPGLPGLRAFQRAHAQIARRWLRRRIESR